MTVFVFGIRAMVGNQHSQPVCAKLIICRAQPNAHCRSLDGY